MCLRHTIEEPAQSINAPAPVIPTITAPVIPTIPTPNTHALENEQHTNIVPPSQPLQVNVSNESIKIKDSNSFFSEEGLILPILGLIGSVLIFFIIKFIVRNKEMNNQEAIRKYFKPMPKWAILAIVIGVILFAGKNSVALAIGLLFTAIGSWALINWMRKPTDVEMDSFIKEALDGICEHSLKKLGVDESDLVGDSIEIKGFVLEDTAGADWLWKVGKDKIVRFTPIKVIFLHLAQHQLLSYECVLDLITNKPLRERTDEFFYKDIVSVSTKSDSQVMKLKNKKFNDVVLSNSETFVLTTSGGTSISCFLGDPKLVQLLGGEIPESLSDNTIQSIRKMLREKKES